MSEELNISEPINEEEALAGPSKKRKVTTGWLRTKPIETIETTNEQEASREDFKPVKEEADLVSEEQEAVTASKKRKYAKRRKKAIGGAARTNDLIGGKRRKKQPTRRDQPREKVVKEKAHTYTVAFVRHW